jgi:hypothetical protein
MFALDGTRVDEHGDDVVVRMVLTSRPAELRMLKKGGEVRGSVMDGWKWIKGKRQQRVTGSILFSPSCLETDDEPFDSSSRAAAHNPQARSQAGQE